MNYFFARHCLAVSVLLFSLLDLCWAESQEFHKTFPVSNAETLKLAVDIPDGDFEVAYSHDGEVTITAVARSSGENKIDENYFRDGLSIEQTGNRITIQQVSNSLYPAVKLQFRVDVPYRTEITSSVKHGKQNVRGVTGPIDLRGTGDVSVSYVSQTAAVDVERGNLSFQMVADHVLARTGNGSISAERLPKGIRAETGDGDIKLMVVGASEAIVRSGTGRIEIGGARDKVMGVTDRGDLRVRAVPYGDWNLRSISGAIRVELPEQVSCQWDVSSGSGKLEFDRADLQNPSPDAHQFSYKVRGGDRKIEVHSESGDIWIR